MSTKYLVLPRIEYRGANAQPAWWCVAPPGPMSHCGFAHALGRALAIPQAVQGVAIAQHDWRLRAETPGRGGWLVHPHQFRAAALINGDDYSQGSRSLSSQPTVRGDGVVTLIIAFDEDAAIDARLVERFLHRARIAGGTIERHGFKPNAMLLEHDWQAAARSVRGGFTLVDRTDLLASEDGEDMLAALLRVTRRLRDAKGRPQAAAHPWLSPYLAGLRALSPPAARSLARDGYEHAYAEPLVGLAQYAPAGSQIAFWHYARVDAHRRTWAVEQTVLLQDSVPGTRFRKPSVATQSATSNQEV